jgi:DNA-binding SARP family transcriptional activator
MHIIKPDDKRPVRGNALQQPADRPLDLLGRTARPGGDKVTVPGKRERVLLAYLALSPDCRTSRRKLTALLWGDASANTTLDNLRVCVRGLRKALGDAKHHIVASDGEDIVLDAAAFDVDAWAYRRLSTQSGQTELEAAGSTSVQIKNNVRTAAQMKFTVSMIAALRLLSKMLSD